MDLWPAGKKPGSGAKLPEAPLKDKGDGVTRMTNVSQPQLKLFPLDHPAKPRPAIIVCPGGGYSYVVLDKEGEKIARWLNGLHYHAIVLKYRVPNNRAGAFQDAQRALRLVRSKASEWKIDPARIGIMGFSAGGNLAAKASALYETPSYPPIDAVDQLSSRPDFAVLVYPAYLDDRNGHLNPDLAGDSVRPPMLIVHSEDDQKFIAGTRFYRDFLLARHADFQALIYPTGGHGYGLECQREARKWPEDAAIWLKEKAGP